MLGQAALGLGEQPSLPRGELVAAGATSVGLGVYVYVISGV